MFAALAIIKKFGLSPYLPSCRRPEDFLQAPSFGLLLVLEAVRQVSGQTCLGNQSVTCHTAVTLIKWYLFSSGQLYFGPRISSILGAVQVLVFCSVCLWDLRKYAVSKVKSYQISLGNRITVSFLLGPKYSTRSKSLRVSDLAVCSSASAENAARISPASQKIIHAVRAVSLDLLVALNADADTAPYTCPAENQSLDVSPRKAWIL